ncbi:preprotein translocase subunit SecE [Psychromonas antarctica]|jgi:preprotein translocase subunit SecE|uniref:preprotein translocase subunit SecE n=1 Tax=Psychromonas antarctica TaxID=67573 RepID=UPI001EE8C859|nr:preprotein translocase subunit SecE [Psychromonas antarctica]MCG6200283.1 preprotein translocase subunit SecE [Psychromonas antarctica]
MSTKNTENTTSSLDGLKWGITILLLAAIIVGNYIYGESLHIVARVGVLLLLAALAVFSAAMTEKGRIFVDFAKESRLEVRKVVWPTRQETIQTTLIILAVSTIVGLVLWGLDGVFVRVVEFITTAI